MTPVVPLLSSSTIVPQSWDLYIPYFTRLYENVAYNINQKDNNFFPMAITNSATDIQNLPTFGSFIICVSGIQQGLPCITASLCKSNATSAGSIAVLGSQAGTIAPWAAATLTITSTGTHFQIAHSVANTSGNFNIRFIGTQ